MLTSGKSNLNHNLLQRMQFLIAIYWKFFPIRLLINSQRLSTTSAPLFILSTFLRFQPILRLENENIKEKI